MFGLETVDSYAVFGEQAILPESGVFSSGFCFSGLSTKAENACKTKAESCLILGFALTSTLLMQNDFHGEAVDEKSTGFDLGYRHFRACSYARFVFLLEEFYRGGGISHGIPT